jgi:hypothetical protein
VIDLENSFKKYQEKVEAADALEDQVTAAHFLQTKIEAHLELLCVLGLMDQLSKAKKK